MIGFVGIDLDPIIADSPQSFWGEHRRRGAGKTARHLVKRISMEHGVVLNTPVATQILEGLRRQTIRNHILDMENCGAPCSSSFQVASYAFAAFAAILAVYLGGRPWPSNWLQLVGLGRFRCHNMSTFSARLYWKTRNQNSELGFCHRGTLLNLGTFSLVSFDHSWYQLRFLLWSNAPWYSRGALLPVVAFAWGCLAVSCCFQIFQYILIVLEQDFLWFACNSGVGTRASGATPVGLLLVAHFQKRILWMNGPFFLQGWRI